MVRSSARQPETARASDVGSQGSAGVLDEDVDRDDGARATGYLGKSSDIQWWRRAKGRRDVELSELHDRNVGPGDAGISESLPDIRTIDRNLSLGSDQPLSAASYHLDDLEMLSTSSVDAYEMPTSSVSDRLLEYYKVSTHTEFPFIDVHWVANRISDVSLEPQSHVKSRAGSRERAILNIIFAIGASYAHLIGDAQGDERDHYLYYTRARMLGLEGGSFVNHPDIQVVQLAALTGFYYLCSSQINRYVHRIILYYLSEKSQLMDDIWLRHTCCFCAWAAYSQYRCCTSSSC
jgi:hypothetical protein